ncbi:hypothetical protein J1782_08685 [Rahnella sp. BCC 1045]|uniref:hypothetical protein n=1 Tax=Rahnella sp. BCC 1045 TaxID=2816251 RepID=UPI001C26E25F|nr:hypothetical protein [Rahnella sp. BCC 1045]MBU9819963.1 hypothetical protein [Rahnella sp. BCC 1045]
MKLITKNFRLNALANTYSAALYDHICKENGSPVFTINTAGSPVQVNIVDGVSGLRDLVDEFYLNALKKNYQGWEAMGLALMSKCLNGTELTQSGLQIWQSMVNDMGDSLAEAQNG